LSELCEATGANIQEVAKAIGMDSRIGSKFLQSSVGFGGSCFQKDILNLVYISKSLGLNEVADYWHQVILMNNHQRDRFAKNIIKTLYSTVNGKTISFLGWAFKKDTNDTRESAAIYVADLLLDEKATIKVFDPKVTATQMQSDLNYLNSRSEKENTNLLKTERDPYAALEGAHAIAVLTEWDEFRTYDWKRIYKNMQKPAFVFDGRNVLDREALEKIGFMYKGIGF
jgi:UDPglucose 6-dehydrogenase